MAAIIGTSGDDDLDGTGVADSFDLTQGGDDTADGGQGDDTFTLGAAFTAADRLTGGLGIDVLELDGDYSAGLVLGASTLVGFERINLAGGHSYGLTMNDATVVAGLVRVDASALGAGEQLLFDASAESESSYIVNGGQGDDRITTGAGEDTIDLFAGGDDTADAGAGDDFFGIEGAAALTRADRLDGGGGFDILSLNGDFAAGAKLSGPALVNVEQINLQPGGSYALTVADGNVAAGKSLILNAASSTAGQFIHFKGKAELDGHFDLRCGASDDQLTTGAQDDSLSGGAGDDRLDGKGGADLITGGLGSDVMAGGGGADIFVFTAVGDSPTAGPDFIRDLAKVDLIDLSAIDADAGTGGDQAFVLVAALSGHAGEAALKYNATADVTKLMLDVDGDGAADAVISLRGDQTGFHHFVL